MINIHIDTLAILYGLCFFLVYLTLKYLMNNKNKNYINKDSEMVKRNKKNIEEIIPININDIKCSCKTFFIDEEELVNCNFCIQRYIQHVEESNKKRKKCMSFPN